MSEIDLTDAKRRCADMASKPEGGYGRNLSENDRESIRIVLANLLGLEQSSLLRDLDRKLAADISALLRKHYPDYEGPLVALIEKALADLQDANRRASEVPGLSATLDEVRAERDAAVEARARTEKDSAAACARMRAKVAELRAERTGDEGGETRGYEDAELSQHALRIRVAAERGRATKAEADRDLLGEALRALLESATEQQEALRSAESIAHELRAVHDIEVRRAVQEEREACAKTLERIFAKGQWWFFAGVLDAIRARGGSPFAPSDEAANQEPAKGSR